MDGEEPQRPLSEPQGGMKPEMTENKAVRWRAEVVSGAVGIKRPVGVECYWGVLAGDSERSTTSQSIASWVRYSSGNSI